MLISSLEQNRSCKTDSRWANKDIPLFCWNYKIYYMCPSLDTLQSQINLAHTLTPSLASLYTWASQIISCLQAFRLNFCKLRLLQARYFLVSGAELVNRAQKKPQSY
jgi:hypothetical protein